MSEMVERVARAISGAPFPSQASIRKARAAIEAMREPTEAMMEAGWPHTADPCWLENVGKTWSAMIDEALK